MVIDLLLEDVPQLVLPCFFVYVNDSYDDTNTRLALMSILATCMVVGCNIILLSWTFHKVVLLDHV